jgi:hypothetical protein
MCNGRAEFKLYGNIFRWLFRRPKDIVLCPACHGAGVIPQHDP